MSQEAIDAQVRLLARSLTARFLTWYFIVFSHRT